MKRPSALSALAVLVYAFLYAPLVVLVLFSFNDARLASTWRGFTLSWYLGILDDTQILGALRNSLLIGFTATLVCTVLGTAAALGLRRLRGTDWLVGLLLLPLLTPEVVAGASLLLLFAVAGLRLGFLSIVLAHVSFALSYAILVVRARLAHLDPALEEAAADLGATPLRVFRHVTWPAIAPGVMAAALLVFALSVDDYVVTSFVSGVGSTTLPVQIYSMVKSGISPAINAVSTLLLLATALLLFASWRLEQGAAGLGSAVAALLGLGILGLPFALTAGAPAPGRVLNVFIWSNYIAPETVKKFEARHGVRVNVDLYDSNEALLAKVQAGNSGYDVLCPSNYVVEVLVRSSLLLPLDHGALPHLANLDPDFVDRPFDPGNAHSVPYFWGTTGIAHDTRRVPVVDSWSVLFDPRWRGRVLMLDDPRETLGAALKLKGHSLNTTDPGLLRQAQQLLIAQKPLVQAYNSSNFEDVLLSGDVWVAQGWNGQFARAMEQEGAIRYVIPREGSSLFIDNLVIPRTAPHPELAHAFLDFTMEAEIAAEICETMRYSSPNRAAVALLPTELRQNPAMFPPAEARARLELMGDVGDHAALYERLWTEVKSH